MIPNLEGALCVGQWWIFESTLLADHLEARELCDECPVIAACRERLHEQMEPVGTWAGALVGTGKRKPREHGTERGYQQHRHQRETQCQPCRLAHNRHVRDAVRKPVRGRIGAQHNEPQPRYLAVRNWGSTDQTLGA